MTDTEELKLLLWDISRDGTFRHGHAVRADELLKGYVPPAGHVVSRQVCQTDLQWDYDKCGSYNNTDWGE